MYTMWPRYYSCRYRRAATALYNGFIWYAGQGSLMPLKISLRSRMLISIICASGTAWHRLLLLSLSAFRYLHRLILVSYARAEFFAARLIHNSSLRFQALDFYFHYSPWPLLHDISSCRRKQKMTAYQLHTTISCVKKANIATILFL